MGNFACKPLNAWGLFSVIPGIFAWRVGACVKAMGHFKGMTSPRLNVITREASHPNKRKPNPTQLLKQSIALQLAGYMRVLLSGMPEGVVW